MIEVVPEPKAKAGGGRIGVRPISSVPALGVKEAAVESVIHPAKVVEALVVGLGRMITGQEKPEVSGPVGIVRRPAAPLNKVRLSTCSCSGCSRPIWAVSTCCLSPRSTAGG